MKKGLISVILLNFVNVLNFAIMIPVLPFIVEKYGGGSLMYGVLLSLYPFFQFFAAPILGAYSDHYGRRPILLLSQAGTLLSWVIFASAYFIPEIYIGPVALPFAVIMLARIADGATGGNNSVANAYLTDITKPEERTKMFGYLGAVVGIGLLVGPSIGGYTSSLPIGFLATALAAIAISTVTLIVMFFQLPETLDRTHRDPSIHFKLSDEIRFISKLKTYAQTRTIKYLFFIRAFFLIVFNAYVSILVLFIIDAFGLRQREIGNLFLILGSFSIINQLLIVRFISHRIGTLKTFIFGQSLIILVLFILPHVPSLSVFIVTIYFMNLGFSSSFPTFKSLISNSVDKSKQGEMQGIDESFVAAGSAIAPILAGLVYAHVGRYAFAFFSSLLIVPLLIFVVRFPKKASE